MKKWLGLIELIVFGLLTGSVFASGAEISLKVSGKDEVKINKPFEVLIEISAVESTLGTDLKLKYDTDKLELIEVVQGNVYPNFSNPETLVKADGELFLSGVSDLTKGVVPNGELARIKLQAIKAGETEIKVVYDLADTTATAVIPFEGDEVNLLTQAPESLVIEVGGGSWWQWLVDWTKALWVDIRGLW